MKKRGKRILLSILAIVAIVAGAGFTYVSPMLFMHPAPTGAVDGTDILALHNGLNSLYFTPVEDGYLLIDAGSNISKATQGLAEIHIDPQEVRYILLTHSDTDHVAALSLFPNAQIYLAKDELQMVDGTTRRNAFSRNSLAGEITPANIIPLEDGQRIALGGRSVACIAVPGHTPGSMAYLLNGQYLFTGDAFRAKNGTLLVHPYTMDNGAAKSSMEKLAPVIAEAELVLTAHYGYYKP